MSSWITMAVWDTLENNRAWMTALTLESLAATVDWRKHGLMISDNGSCKATQELYGLYAPIIDHIEFNGENLGTAAALNRLWALISDDEGCIVKIDNDVKIHQDGWLDRMELVFEREPSVGICGLKRKDLEEWPIQQASRAASFYASTLKAVPLPHRKGEKWDYLVLEVVNHVMGTCQGYRASLIGTGKEFGYLHQPGVYGFDDALASLRMQLLGYQVVFLLGIDIDHIDPGGSGYTRWKQEEAARMMDTYNRYVRMYQSGEMPVYYGG